MDILVTGSKGFIALNLIAQLENSGYHVLQFDRGMDTALLVEHVKKCEFVFHLAGVNRPEDETEYWTGNVDFTSKLLHIIRDNQRHIPVLFSSSIQAGLDNAYGKSKRAGEALVTQYSRETGTDCYIYRLPNVFGKWCRPNYNSVVATFCHNLANGLDITVDDPAEKLYLVYVDDVVSEWLAILEGHASKVKDGFCEVGPVYEATVGKIANKLRAFRNGRDNMIIPSFADEFDRKLYAVWLSHLQPEKLSYQLDRRADCRGWLCEFLKSEATGQIFLSRTKPGFTRGNHWHHTKVEKFLVVEGEAVISLQNQRSGQILRFPVSGDRPRVVDIPPGYAHAITNAGSGDLVTLFWADEIFDAARPDTYIQQIPGPYLAKLPEQGAAGAGSRPYKGNEAKNDQT